MIKLPYEKIVEAIVEKSGLSEKDIHSKVDMKLKQLSGLISKEGAAHIVANELGIKLFSAATGGKVQIKNILSGMRNVETMGKVLQVYDVSEFKREDSTGKVGSLVMGDETGTIRVVFWNDQADKIAKIAVGDILKLKAGYVRERTGRLEVHLNDRSVVIVNPPGETIGEVAVVKREDAARKNIKDLQETDSNVEILGTIVQVFNPNFFEVCPQCKKRAREGPSGFACETHGTVTPVFNYVVNLFVDDGTENIRTVCFRNHAERILGKNAEEMLLFRDDMDRFEQVKNDVLGNVVKMQGRVTKNAMFDRLEFIASSVVADVDPEAEMKRIDSEKKKLP